MKKLKTVMLLALFTSCEKYSKDAIVHKDFGGDNSYYCLRIFENNTFFNNGAIKIYTLKDEQINEHNIDSVNIQADKFIDLLNKKL